MEKNWRAENIEEAKKLMRILEEKISRNKQKNWGENIYIQNEKNFDKFIFASKRKEKSSDKKISFKIKGNSGKICEKNLQKKLIRGDKEDPIPRGWDGNGSKPIRFCRSKPKLMKNIWTH